MYNEETKRRYISERSKEVIYSNNYLECLFEKVAATEEKLNKDLCNFSFYEIIEFYKLLNTASVSMISVTNSQYSIYAQWCLQQNLVTDGQNHFLEMRTEDFVNCINKALFDLKVISKEILMDWVDQIPNPKDQFILLALFEGIKGKDFCEIANLKPEDVKNNIASLSTGRSVVISDKLNDIILDCINETVYYSTTGKEVKTMPLMDRGYVIKDYPNTKDDVSDFQRGRQIYNSIKRITEYIGIYPSVSAKNITESGMLDMIKSRSKELGVNCIDYIKSKNFSEIEEKYDCTIKKKGYIIKYKDYLV